MNKILITVFLILASLPAFAQNMGEECEGWARGGQRSLFWKRPSEPKDLIGIFCSPLYCGIMAEHMRRLDNTIDNAWWCEE
jgi:hypothetical protein